MRLAARVNNEVERRTLFPTVAKFSLSLFGIDVQKKVELSGRNEGSFERIIKNTTRRVEIFYHSFENPKLLPLTTLILQS